MLPMGTLVQGAQVPAGVNKLLPYTEANPASCLKVQEGECCHPTLPWGEKVQGSLQWKVRTFTASASYID